MPSRIRVPFFIAISLVVSGLGYAVGCSSDSPAAKISDASAVDVVSSEAASADADCAQLTSAASETKVSLPAPPGDYGVARSPRRTLVDSTRDEPDTADPNDKRKLSFEIWYPTEKCSAGEEAPLFDEPEAALFPIKEKGWWDGVRTRVRRAGPMVADGKRHPVLLFSSGYGFVPRAYTVVISSLVSRGFVVIGLSHPFYDLVTVFEDGSVAAQTHPTPTRASEGGREIVTWIADQRAMLDALSGIDGSDPAGAVMGRLDLERIGSFGHSFGGATAIQLVASDARVKAALNLDGFMFTPEAAAPDAGADAMAGDAASDAAPAPLSPIARPILFMRSDRDSDPTVAETFARATGPAYEVVLGKSGHLSFTDQGAVYPALGMPLGAGRFGSIDPARAHTVTNAYVAAFFAQHLTEKTDPLLAGPSPDFPEMTFVPH